MLSVTVAAVAGCKAFESYELPYDSRNPIVHTNDGNIDVYTLEYVMALASAQEIQLVGVVADAGGGGPDRPPTWYRGRNLYAEIVAKARRSGMLRLPDPVAGPNRALAKPASGVIEDTVPIDTPGSRLIVREARKASPQKPLVVITGGPLTSVASAYLIDKSIADNVVVASLLGTRNDENHKI